MRRLPVWRRAIKSGTNAVRDLRYGRVLGGTIRTRYAEAGAFHVTNSDYEDLPTLFSAVSASPGDVFVDVGAGKGRVINWWLQRFPGARIYGIELDPEVYAGTARRLRRRRNVTLLCGDATELLPPDGTIFYLFNPFDEVVLRRFIASLRGLPPTPDGRTRRVVYYNAKYAHLFEEEPGLAVSEIVLPSGSHRSLAIEVATPVDAVP